MSARLALGIEANGRDYAAATLSRIEATLGTLQQGIHEKFIPLIVRKVTARPPTRSS